MKIKRRRGKSISKQQVRRAANREFRKAMTLLTADLKTPLVFTSQISPTFLEHVYAGMA